MIQLSYRNLLRNKGRTFLTTIGIIIGVAAIISLVSISDGILNEADSTLGTLQYYTLMEKGALDDTLSHIPIEVIDRVSRVRGVSHFSPQINIFASSFNGQNLDASSFTGTDFDLIAIMGIEPRDAKDFEDSIQWYKAVNGRMIEQGEENSILVNTQLAEDYDLFIGSVVEVNGENFRIVGFVDFDLSLGFSYNLIVMDIDKVRELSDYTNEEVGIINVLPDDVTSVEKFTQRLEDSIPEINVFSSQQMSEMIGTFLGTLSVALWFVSSIAGVVGGVVVMNTMLMSVMERIQEFGVLKAIGWKNSQVVFMIIGEALIIGLFSGIIGVLFGFIGSYSVELFTGIPTLVTPLLIIQVLFFAVGVSVISAVYPAYIAAGMSPIEAVTYE